MRSKLGLGMNKGETGKKGEEAFANMSEGVLLYRVL